ncbi:hypothetical protein [Jatrophihabitans sp.]|uniref:hypothetical protein n=1 Tax=Jatrophihabitans sp. TaxID=1932789 RepID=UPI0030C6DD7C|nr:hypothetical protein [Jatrophihabitans sp.]
MNAFPWSSGPASGSWLDNWLERRRRAPGVFDCGVRTIEGSVATEGRRWRYRPSSVDPLILDGVVTLQHGIGSTLHLRMAPAPPGDPSPGIRQHHVVLAAVERDSGALLELSVDLGEVARFGVELS